MNHVIDARAVVQRPVAAEELRKWPLMHGTLCTGAELEEIRREGLIAVTRNLNSFDYDHELGRTSFVFLAPASFRLNYGFGLGGVLVDSAVLQRSDLDFSDNDLGAVVECLKILSEGHGYCGAVKNPDALGCFVKLQQEQSPKSEPYEIVKLIIRSQEFADYWSRNYRLTKEELFKRIENEANAFRFSLHEYFARSGIWPLHEEVLVPKAVRPEHLLGHWDGQRWTEWTKASTPEVQSRLEVWIEAARDFRMP